MDITKTEAFKLAKAYAGQWVNLCEDDVTLTSLTGGHSSRLVLLENKTTRDRIVVRFITTKLPEDSAYKDIKLCEAIEAVVAHRMGELGLGPKVLGVFDGGRVEQFIPSRTLTDEHLERQDIRLSIARQLARIHCTVTDLPIKKEPRPNAKLIVANFELFDTAEGRQNFVEYAEMVQFDPEPFLTFDWRAEFSWLKSLKQKTDGN